MYEDEIAYAATMENFFRENRAMEQKRYYLPTETQMKSVVRGDDRYQPFRYQHPLLCQLLLLAVVIGCVIGILWIAAGGAR